MRKLTIVPLSIAAIFTACDPGSTSPDPLVKGEMIYERHIDNSTGNVQCKVYATDYSVSLDLNVSFLSDESYVSEQIETNFKNPATFRAEMKVSGLFAMKKDEMCSNIKELSADMGNGTYSCNDNSATVSSQIPNANEDSKSYYVSTMKSQMSNLCDYYHSHFTDKFNELTQYLNNEGNNPNNEKATSCNVIENGNSVQVAITYPNKSALISATFVNGSFAMKEEYTGIDEASLARACASYKTETEIKDVNCSGSTITYNSIGLESVDLAAFVAYEKQIICPAMLSGAMTLEDLWNE